MWVEAGNEAVAYRPAGEDAQRAACLVVGDVEAYCAAVRRNQPRLLWNRMAQLYYDCHLPDSLRQDIALAHALGRTELYSRVYASDGRKLVRDQVPDAGRSARLYFGELTEAYWGENDFYPFDCEELERYDPRGFEALRAVYGERALTPNEHGISLPPEGLTQWLAGVESPLDAYYRKYIDAEGMPILSSRFVRDEALLQARRIVVAMLSRIPEAKAEMLACHFRVGVIGANENVTDMPENRMMNIWWPETDWDARGRGYGATETIPLMTCGEENIVKIPGQADRYRDESIMVHEFAHNVDFSVSGGGKNNRYYTSLSYSKSDGTLIATDFERYSGKVAQMLNLCTIKCSWHTFYYRAQT